MTVSELNLAAKNLLEAHFGDIEVVGELSRLIRHTSGHWYFTLKDENASISVAMFKFSNTKVKFNPQNGDKVVLKGKLSIYPQNGSYQLIASKMLPSGVGELELAFNELKERLSKEGLFDLSHKKPLPKFPKQIAIITSGTSAAFQDMIHRIENSGYFLAKFYLFDSLVQGEKASISLIKNLKKADEFNFDVIILSRGGGSKEDLWCFNDENLARAIYEAKTPIISAVGHEIDYSISDFVADHRSITPTASIDDLLPSRDNLEQNLDQKENVLNSFIKDKLNKLELLIKNKNLELKSLAISQKMQIAKQNLSIKENELKNKMEKILALYENELDKKEEILRQRKLFFEQSKDLVNIQKDGKNISLDKLNSGDIFNLVSQNTKKQAQIL